MSARDGAPQNAAEERRTLAREAHIEFIERKSVFRGHAKPVGSEAEALAFVQEMRHMYADATHNVFAYSLRQNGICRYSDDGEPQGTAGIPVLDCIRKRGFDDACLVVTRYFGGILLGTGGLVRAYSAAARMAADEAGIVTLCSMTECTLRCDYATYQRVAAILPDFEARISDSRFESDVTLQILLKTTVFPVFCERIREMTAGRCAPDPVRTFFGA